MSLLAQVVSETLVVFCAAYLAEENDIADLVRLLDTWCAQTVHVPIYVSLRTSNSAIASAAQRRIQQWKTRNNAAEIELTSLVHIVSYASGSGAHSAFTQYAALCEQPWTETPPRWVLFAELGSTWHVTRIEVYLQTMFQSFEQGIFTDQVAAITAIRNDDDFAQHLPYESYAVRYMALVHFCRTAHRNLLTHPEWCTRYFVRYLKAPNAQLKFLGAETPNVLYTRNDEPPVRERIWPSNARKRIRAQLTQHLCGDYLLGSYGTPTWPVFRSYMLQRTAYAEDELRALYGDNREENLFQGLCRSDWKSYIEAPLLTYEVMRRL